MSNVIRSIIVIVFTSLALEGCNINTPAELALVTQAVATPISTTVSPADYFVQVTPTAEILLSMPSEPVEQPAPPPQPVSAAGAPNGRPCDLIAPGLPFDVTVPDGTQMRPGEKFSKTWRLVNTGSCNWTQGYAVVWFSGERMGPDVEWRLPGEVPPGAVVDIPVDLVAPEAPGVHQSNWKLRNAQGEYFGLGPNGDAPFWVIVEVKAESTATVPAAATTLPTLAVHNSGILSIVAGQALDLDGSDLEDARSLDLIYQVDAGGQPRLAPQNGARLSLFGASEPVLADCEQSPMGTEPVAFQQQGGGMYLCFRTSQGLLGFAHAARTGDDGNLLALDYITWNMP